MKKYVVAFFILIIFASLFFFKDYAPYVIKNIGEKTKEEAFVTQVVDGDTIVIEGGQRIRLLGIDAHEKGERIYKEAKIFLESKILHKEVMLEKDKTEKDRYNRLLRWIWLENEEENELVNAAVVREGLAIAKFYEGDEKYQNLIAKAEKEAMAEKKGIWAEKK